MSKGLEKKSLENQSLKGGRGRGSPGVDKERIIVRYSVNHKKCWITETQRAQL